jgi:hypothetical protein
MDLRIRSWIASFVIIRSTDMRKPETAAQRAERWGRSLSLRITARSRSLSSRGVPLAREPKATIFTGSAASMMRRSAVQTFSSVTDQEVSPVCGMAAVIADCAASIPHWWADLKGAVKPSNIDRDEFVRWRGVRAGEMSGREPTFYLVYFWWPTASVGCGWRWGRERKREVSRFRANALHSG